MLLAKQLREAHWHLEVGDPTVLGWITAVAYLAAAIGCALCWRNRRQLIDGAGARRFAMYWLVMAVVMLLLAFNKQLDLQKLIYITGRNLAIRQGWFDQRREVMRMVVLGVGIVGVLSVGVVLLAMNGLWSRLWLSVLGITLLAGFAVIRTGELLDLNHLTKAQLIGPVHLSHVIELLAITLVLLGSVLCNRPRKTAGQTVSHSPT